MKKPIALLSVVMLAACQESVPDSHDHPQAVTGKQLFELHCAVCHKKSGAGKFLKGIPANKYSELTGWQIVNKLKEGSVNSGMPTFSDMPLDEAEKIARYVKKLKYDSDKQRNSN